MMNSYWINIFEILAPALPLLLCHASRQTTLGMLRFFTFCSNCNCELTTKQLTSNIFLTGRAILSMLSPESDLPTQYLVQGNVILLFNNDYRIRQDAVAALMYLLLDQEDADLYLPNIKNITDVIPSNICILDNVINPKQKVITGIHEVELYIFIKRQSIQF